MKSWVYFAGKLLEPVKIWLASLWAAFVSLVNVHPQYIVVFMILITLDFITGVWKSKKEGLEISSWGMRRTINKLAPYFITLFAVMLISNLQIPHLEILKYTDDWLFALIFFIEGKSIFENVGKLEWFNKLISLAKKKGRDTLQELDS
jgi:phage-related holin